ncbi:GNAT family N-acetyltransferase [Natrialba asiatica]|uniref:N-acetyltransferase GCN5 n=1 Tax=Natrialba asiatica (strain ATCC 700177 / DSM 12278 / JCM 9576 / FERM P-10747 / NBRC 102637 / 172P1) TaxID=29540 RepID=M0B559_NATA1|nr:GNAT family protein [Natrialba asiatica]ELZ05945.1 N-acetyltransferase GCN5 [Natrialba asiatica DSM 12278]
MFPEHIETDRLSLERISHDSVDVFALHELYSDGDDTEETFEYWDSEPHETVKETYDYVDEAEELWNDVQGAKYVIRPNERENGAGVIAGTTGLYPHWEKRSVNLGILLDKQFWGRGYSGERADALLSVAFDRLNLELVVAAHIDGNAKSRRAINKYVERYGGQYEGLLRNWLPLSDTVADVHRYTVSREEYLEATKR